MYFAGLRIRDEDVRELIALVNGPTRSFLWALDDVRTDALAQVRAVLLQTPVSDTVSDTGENEWRVREALVQRNGFRLPPIGHFAHMPGRLYEIRFPNGDFEIDAFTQKPPPEIGETLHRRGELWRVVSKSSEAPFVVQVEPVADLGKASGSSALDGG